VRRAAAAAVLLAAALPGTAQAADYGGGTVPKSRLTLVGIRTAGDGSARVSVKVATCIVATTAETVQVAADGTFSLDTIVRGRVREDPTLRQRTRIRASGQIAGSAGSGTVEAHVRLTRGGRRIDRCRSGTRTWQAREAVAEPTPAPPRPDGAYYGATSQSGRPFVLHVDAQGTRVRTAAFAYSQSCRDGRFTWENVTPGAPIAADGTFSLRERFSYRWAEGVERFRVRVDGRFTTTGASGTLSVSSVLRSKSGRVLDRCATGNVTFAALL
jgi:hypothetical protein